QPHLAARIEKNTLREFPDGIPSYGADALRFTCCALASTGRDVRFDFKQIEGYRNFCNKLWNASRFVMMNCEAADLSQIGTPSIVDRWILSRTRSMLEDSERAIETYRFDLYANHIYEFTWGEYCDWYLELTKPLLWDDDADPAMAAGTRRTLLMVLEILLRAAHPIIPFITDKIWRDVAPLNSLTGSTIMTQPFPLAHEIAADKEADDAIEWLKGVIVGVRNIRGEAGIKPKQTIDLLLQGGGERDRALAATTDQLLKRLAKVENIRWLHAEEVAPVNALALVGDLKVMVPLAGLIDLDAEKARLQKEIDRRQAEVSRVTGKLGNAKFVANAPPEVVASEREKAQAAQDALRALHTQLLSLNNL
ncbi:MAG: class I tRNA ligase family protein, partial [Proteobacteria bacterium]|nr:class I tRNA ligase family protein [Pseudomonadota bacterium]